MRRGLQAESGAPEMSTPINSSFIIAKSINGEIDRVIGEEDERREGRTEMERVNARCE